MGHYPELSKDYVFRFPANPFRTYKVGPQSVVLAQLDDFSNKPFEPFDVISDEGLVRWGNEFLSESSSRLSKVNLREFRCEIESMKFANRDSDVRWERLLNIVHQTEVYLANRSNLINSFLGTDAGKKEIQGYLNNNRNLILKVAEERYSKEFSEQRNNHIKKQQDLEGEVQDLEVRKKSAEEELGRAQEALKQKNKESLDAELIQAGEELEAKKEELREVLSRVAQAVEVTELEYEVRAQKRLRDDARSEADEARRTLENLQNTHMEVRADINRAVEDQRKQLRTLKPYIDLLNGVIDEPLGLPRTGGLREIRREKLPVSAKELVSEVQTSLEHYGRSFEFHEVANFLVTLEGNFLTVFAGLPGVGKTSLVTLLARALGLEQANTFLPISTARGWTSQRDILGFYNPLNGSFQTAPTGLYGLLQDAQNTNDDAATRLVMLDEGNLSPVEHFFSTFLGMADEHGSRVIRTGIPGEDGQLRVAPNIRFVATVNYDATTEPLSPRVLDRAPVIILDPDAYISDINESKSQPLPTSGTIPHAHLNTLLTPDEEMWTLTDDEDRLFQAIHQILRDTSSSLGSPVIVSPRKRQAVYTYCASARELMSSAYALCAFDYAVAQFVLPLIQDYGPRFKTRLQGLLTVLEPLDRSKRLLKQVIDQGDENHAYYRTLG